ncbi:hypothetical protein E2I00_006462, partial [Balaenoptera physalus]
GFRGRRLGFREKASDFDKGRGRYTGSRNLAPAWTNQAAESGSSAGKDTGLYYHRYLQEVINVLETDGHFREKLQAANAEDIKSGKLSRELDFVSHHVRTKLDELKRQENDSNFLAFIYVQLDHLSLLKQFEHLDPQNQHTFEARDLELLIQTVDLEIVEDLREGKGLILCPDHWELEIKSFCMTVGPRMVPVESQDPDINSDGVLDEQELEALFTKEVSILEAMGAEDAQLEKVYDPKNEEDDMREMEEERLRMREHVMKNVRGGTRAAGEGGGRGGGRSSSVVYPYLAPQVDTNQDRLVTLEEFLVSTQRKEFGDTGEGWETVEMHPAYTEDELRRFEEELAAREAELNAKAQRLSQETEALGRSQGRLEAQKRELQQAVLQMEQRKQQQQVHNNPAPGPEGQLKFHPDTGAGPWAQGAGKELGAQTPGSEGGGADDAPVPAPAGDQKDVDPSEKKVPEQTPELPQLESQHL